MAYETILYEKDPPIGRIVLNQPEKRNPLSYLRLREIAEAAKEMERKIMEQRGLTLDDFLDQFHLP